MEGGELTSTSNILEEEEKVEEEEGGIGVGRFFLTYVSMFSVGGVLGVAIDFTFTCMYDLLAEGSCDKSDKKWLRLFVANIQMLSLGVVLFGAERLSQRWARQFQSTLPGLAFPALIFGLQTEMYAAIQGVLPYPKCN